MNLRDLQYLVAVADTLHFGRAAAAVHVSQPTLSMQLKKLEETLGVQLLERTNKRVMLTAVGRETVARARRVLAEVEQLKQAASAARDPLAGTLTLGIFPTLAPYLLPRLKLLLVEEKTPELLRRLEAGALDAALLAMPVESPALASATLFTEPFLLALSPAHRLAKRKTVTLTDLKRETVLLLEDGHCLRDQALEVCHTIGIGEAAHFRATSLETLRHMVAASDAVTLMPKLATETGDRAARYIPFASPAPSRMIGLYWRNMSAKTPLFKAIAKNITLNYKK